MVNYLDIELSFLNQQTVVLSLSAETVTLNIALVNFLFLWPVIFHINKEREQSIGTKSDLRTD